MIHSIVHKPYPTTCWLLALMATWLSQWSTATQAQTNDIYVENIKTLQVKMNGEWGEPPVLLLGNGSYVEVSFDDLQPTYVRYTYTLTHCNADWTESGLTPSEYMDGFNDQRIEDYEPSMNTMMEYNHYTFCVPNDELTLRLSGNYRIDIYEDGRDEPVATACFCMMEPHVSIGIDVSGNTDIDTWAQHQQVDFRINYQGYSVQNPAGDLMPVVVQNRRWDNHVEGLKPTYLRTGELIYTHNRSLIFEAGNEYRRFEILDEYVPTMHVESMSFHDPYYHATLMDDKQRTHYLYDQDQNGRYWVRNGDNRDNDTESDYFYTHFRLVMPPVPGGDVFLNGDLTSGHLSEANKMEYNLIDHCYEIVKPLKQGSYNYQYLFVRDGESWGSTLPCEGSFHQTENEYWIYVYHRPFGERYDKLVGFGRHRYSIEKR